MYTHADAESRRRAAQLFRDAIKKAGEDPQQDEKKDRPGRLILVGFSCPFRFLLRFFNVWETAKR
ncbi:MAG: hypothetical protein V8R55_03680 [Dysosmobacter sp.]